MGNPSDRDTYRLHRELEAELDAASIGDDEHDERPALTPEERPVGEHDFSGTGRAGTCRVCGVSDNVGTWAAGPTCPSKRERRWVTPWETVPQEQEERA